MKNSATAVKKALYFKTYFRNFSLLNYVFFFSHVDSYCFKYTTHYNINLICRMTFIIILTDFNIFN